MIVTIMVTMMVTIMVTIMVKFSSTQWCKTRQQKCILIHSCQLIHVQNNADRHDKITINNNSD